MTTPNRLQIFPELIDNQGLMFQLADGTTIKTLTAAGSTGHRIDAIAGTSTDTSPRTFQVYMNDGSVDYPVGQVTIPAGAGTSAVLPVKVLASVSFPWLDPSGALFLKAGWKLNFALTTGAVTTGKAVYFVAFDGGFNQ